MRSRVREMVKEEGIFQGEIGRGQSPGIEGKIGTIPGWKIGGDRNWGNGGWKVGEILAVRVDDRDGMELAAGVREVGNRGRGNRNLERGFGSGWRRTVEGKLEGRLREDGRRGDGGEA